MIVDAGFLTQWTHKGHDYGTCMSHPNGALMYVNIPKNASSWTKPNLLDWGWEFYNYHTDMLTHKAPVVVLREPIERWLSGIAEYFALYYPDFKLNCPEAIELVFDRVCFDDHTERQINFIHGLDTDRCIFLKCDENYRQNFSNLLTEHGMTNRYSNYDYQHVSKNSPDRTRFKEIFEQAIQEPKYLSKVREYFHKDFLLIESIKFYGT
jgi:hypothetical protein